jgi:hypothetical protein
MMKLLVLSLCIFTLIIKLPEGNCWEVPNMSQRLQRYLSVQKAKGQPPNPLVLAQMLREDVGARQTQPGAATVENPGVIAEKRKNMVARGNVAPLGESEIGRDVNTDPIGPPDLATAIGAEMGGISAAKGFFAKGAVKGGITTLAATQAGIPLSEAVPFALQSSLTSVIPAVVTFAKFAKSSVYGGIIGHSLTQAFGESASQEAADVMSGRSSLDSISIGGKMAYSNAQIAMQFSPFGKGVPKGMLSEGVTAKGTSMISTEASILAEQEGISNAASIGGISVEPESSGIFGYTGLGPQPGSQVGGGGHQGDPVGIGGTTGQSATGHTDTGVGGDVGSPGGGGSGGGSDGIGPGNF